MIGIDPGPTFSGAVFLNGADVDDCYKGIPNEELLALLEDVAAAHRRVAIERVRFYGKDIHAGADVFETAEWGGRFFQRSVDVGMHPMWVERKEAAHFLTGTRTAQDKHIRRALLDLYGGEAVAKGTKASPGPLYSVSGHAWASLAIAVTAASILKGGAK